MERVKGIEPSYEAWEAAVLPLNYTRLSESDDNATVRGSVGCTATTGANGAGTAQRLGQISKTKLSRN